MITSERKQMWTATADITDVNIEFAHTKFTIEADFDMQSVRTSAYLARRIAEDIVERGHRCTFSILVDDKHNPGMLSLDHYTPLLAAVRDLVTVDYVFLESRLLNYKLQLLGLLMEDVRKTVERDMDHYLEREGNLACSHDIAIWHLMRLGYVHLAQDDIMATNLSTPGNIAPFVARHVISVLPRSLSGFEERAESEILRHVCAHGTSEHIERVYFEG